MHAVSLELFFPGQLAFCKKAVEGLAAKRIFGSVRKARPLTNPLTKALTKPLTKFVSNDKRFKYRYINKC